MSILKYPRTRHVAGSRHQFGDGVDDFARSDLNGRYLVVEEKVDGANSGFSFKADGTPLLQSRGHYLNGGWRERHFDLFKTWVAAHAWQFFPVFGTRYIVYGEWMYAKHTVFYDKLPHYFLEFDIWDKQENVFLSTVARRELLDGLPIRSVPVVFEGKVDTNLHLERLVSPSLYKSEGWRQAFETAIQHSGSRPDMVAKQSEDTNLAEGLYLKLENEVIVEDRLKFVRGDFLQTIMDSDSHWHDRPIIVNGLADGVDLFAASLEDLS